MPDTPTGFAASGGAQLHYQTAGEGDTIFFIHAGVADSRMWQHQFTDLASNHHLVAYDTRGFGQSVFFDEPFSDHTDALAVMDHLEIGRAVVVACSMGCQTAINLALTAPERVRALVLIGGWPPGFEASAEYEPPQWPELVKAFRAGDMETTADLEAEIWVVGHGRSKADVDPSVFLLVSEMSLIALPQEKARDERVVALDPPAKDRLSEIAVPTLVMIGEYDLPDLQEASVHMAGLFSQQPAQVIPDAAHLPSLEQPVRFNQLLRDFLATL
ncbi:MAG TPA: alpha/beta hydrolase [Acidimicrobiia bacterium]